MRLKFDDERIERDFLKQYAERSLFQVRLAIFLGGFLYALFALLDHVIVGELESYIWKIRFLFVEPAVIIAFALTYTKFGKKHLQEIISILLIIGGIGILWMLAVIKPPALYLYSQGLILVLIFNFTFFRLRFFYALVNGLFLLILFQIVSLRINPIPIPVFVNNNFFLVSTVIIGIVVSYMLETLERRNFLNTVILKNLAETDGLTGVVNRRSFMDAFRLKLKDPGAYPVAFCMLDLDNFKEVNDYYGHLTGDELLKGLGEILQSSFRVSDMVGRLGGDEFGVLMFQLTDHSRIIKAFRSIKGELAKLSTNFGNDITFSVGCVISDYQNGEDDPFFYYSLADFALSTAKGSKNAIFIIGPKKEVLCNEKF